MSPSRRHDVLARVVPRLRKAQELDSPEVERALADLTGLRPALVFCGTCDTLAPGRRMLARRAAEAGWDLTYVEVPDPIHVYPLLPFVPEARAAFDRTVEFLR
jgi:acetyl esterase/lipase